ncbi:MAG TPA: hypothetical protein VIL34_09190 [Actinopolymorphaceae bacterium]|jgi:hypothetical protein
MDTRQTAQTVEDVFQQQPAEACAYHWVMTIQWRAGGGYGQATFDGITRPLPKGFSRAEVYRQLRELVFERAGTDSAAVLFFALEPAEL